MMYQKFKQRPEIGQRFSVLLLSFICLLGVGFGDLSYTKLLESGLGGSAKYKEEDAYIRGTAKFLLGIDPLDLPGVLRKGLPSGMITEEPLQVSDTISQPMEKALFISESFLEEEFAKQPVQVAIYHTHNAETYIPLHGKSKEEGKNSGITMVGEELVEVLAQHRIRAVQDLTIHDYPNHPVSYVNSKVTAKRLLDEYPDLKFLLDLHRDAGIAVKQTAKIDGREAAKLLFVMSNGQRMDNPHWRENQALAREIANRLEEKYPGLVKGVRLKDGNYNQNLSTKAVLIEVGSDKNTLDESLLAIQCLGEVLAELLQEE